MKNIERLLRKGVMGIEPYIPGKPIEEVQEELGISELIKMASNENPLGPSPKAMAAIRREIGNVNLYPEGPCTSLRRRMAERLEIEDDMITFSNGADNCILLAAGAFINEGDEVIMADLTFFVYRTVAKMMQSQTVCVGLRDYVHDLKAMAKKIGPRTKMVFVCNPNNPTGSIVPKQELDDFVRRLPEHVILVLDEAYTEFIMDEGYPSGLDYIRQGYNVLSLRTFSKLYGIAGLRIGYVLGDRALIAALNRVREPFPVSRLAQVAALAALEDEAFKKKVLRINEVGKSYLCDVFDKMGLMYVPSRTNFVFVDLGKDTKAVFQSLLRKGVIIRPGHLWNCPTFARITVGTMQQNRAFIDALKDELSG